MPKVNISYCAAAEYVESGSGTQPTYQNGKKLLKAQAVTTTPQGGGGNPYFELGQLAGDDTSISSENISLQFSDFSLEDFVFVLGRKTETIGGKSVITTTTGDISPFIGIGYVVEHRNRDEVSYRAHVLVKVQMAPNEEAIQQREDNITWQFYTLTGRALADRNTNAIKYSMETGGTLEEAITWINTLFNIST